METSNQIQISCSLYIRYRSWENKWKVKEKLRKKDELCKEYKLELKSKQSSYLKDMGQLK